jgi:hypothetical protein
VVAELVANRDPAKHLVILDDPSARGLLRLTGQPRYPSGESGRRVNLVRRRQPEAVFVEARSPLGMRVEPGTVQPRGRCDQVGHVPTLTIPSTHEDGSKQFAVLDAPNPQQATDQQEELKSYPRASNGLKVQIGRAIVLGEVGPGAR